MEARRLKLICAMILLLVACDFATARSVPLPRPRPALPVVAASAPMPNLSETSQSSACRLRLTSDIATAPSMPPITGPGECEAPDVVRLEAVVLPDRSRVAVTPPAILRCTMAEAIAGWVREEAAPRALDLGSSLTVIENLTSFDCRGRNGIAGAKLSEHGKANALDIQSLRLANGKMVELTDPQVPSNFRESLRKSACVQFTTVLGPGSDGYHEGHIHVDALERRGGYRICEWDVREPGEAPTVPALVASVPLPRARPAINSRNRPQ
jgi:hypothetical protein